MTTCSTCRASTGDGALLCTECTEILLTDLAAVPGVVDDLLTTFCRQDTLRGPGRAVGKSADTPLPWNERVPRPLAGLRTALIEAVQTLHTLGGAAAPTFYATRDPRDPARVPTRVDAATFAARVLTENLERVRQHPSAGDIQDAVRQAVRAARRAVDRSPDRKYIGICSASTPTGPCSADLYVNPTRPTATCPACQTEHDVDARRAVLVDRVHDQLVTPAEAVNALPWLLGRPVRKSTIKGWISDGRLDPEGYRHNGEIVPFRVGYHDEPVLRVADVIREYTRAAQDTAA